MKTMALAAATAVVALACADNTPTSTPTRTAAPRAALAANVAGTQKTPISGTLQIVGVDPPTRTLVTPSDMCRLWNVAEHTVYSGDVQGSVTYIANTKGDCSLTHLVVAGTFGGHVTFQGRSGEMAGHWETNCKFDPALGTLSCDGESNARGSGGLEGVQFHIKWGPGWWPFSYSGTAFSQ
jgi:hypothetical protein